MVYISVHSWAIHFSFCETNNYWVPTTHLMLCWVFPTPVPRDSDKAGGISSSVGEVPGLGQGHWPGWWWPSSCWPAWPPGVAGFPGEALGWFCLCKGVGHLLGGASAWECIPVLGVRGGCYYKLEDWVWVITSAVDRAAITAHRLGFKKQFFGSLIPFFKQTVAEPTLWQKGQRGRQSSVVLHRWAGQHMRMCVCVYMWVCVSTCRWECVCRL